MDSSGYIDNKLHALLSATVDECALEIDNCHAEADCIDTDNGFQCVCRSGYIGDGVNCRGELDNQSYPSCCGFMQKALCKVSTHIDRFHRLFFIMSFSSH